MDRDHQGTMDNYQAAANQRCPEAQSKIGDLEQQGISMSPDFQSHGLVGRGRRTRELCRLLKHRLLDEFGHDVPQKAVARGGRLLN